MPRPLINKILLTPLIGTGCLLFGLVYHCCMHDPIFFGLSGAVFLICTYKAFHFYKIGKSKSYETLNGTVVRIISKMFGKFCTVKVMDEKGIESTIRLPKNLKLRIGNTYCLYFSKVSLSTGRRSLDEKLSTDSFLGFELIQEEQE